MPADQSPGPRPIGADAALPPGRRAASLLTRLDVARRRSEQDSPIGVADARLLWLLSDGEARSLREIAEALGLEQSTVNRQVNGALANGLLRRMEEPGQSAKLIGPTEQGVEAFEAVTAHALGAYESALGVLGEEEAEVFLDLLTRFVSAYSETVGSDAGA